MEQDNGVSAAHSPLIDFDSICQKIRAAIEPARAYAISLHDKSGDVLWLSEGSMGPDEHNAVIEAIEAFAQPEAAPILAFDLGDSRSAMLVRVISARRAMVGAVMLIMDSRIAARGPTRLMTPKLQRAISEFAATRPDSGITVDTASLKIMLATGAHAARPPAQAPTAAAAPAPPALPSGKHIPTLTLSLAASKSPPSAPVASAERRERPATPAIERLHAALRKSPIALYVQRLVPLVKGSQHKRYEVLLRSKSDSAPNSAPAAMLKAAVENGLGSMIDRRVVSELIGWLVHNPAVWQNEQVMFSVNLTTTALYDEHFIHFVELCLAKSSLPKGIIAFEVDAPTALRLMERITEVAGALSRLGCPIVLDDFALRTECFTLLRLPGIRYVKLSSDITTKMRSDKLSQAAITGVVQMSRVLGMHTVAKRTESAAEQEWLTALGVDFVQSNNLSPPVAIETLGKKPSGASASATA